jgi:hypothetical protein
MQGNGCTGVDARQLHHVPLGRITDQGIDNGCKVLPDHHIVFQHHTMLERRGQQRLHGCQVRQVATQLPPVDRFAVLAPVALCVEQRALVVCQLLAMDGGHTLPRQAQTTQLLAHAVQPPGRVIEVDHQNCKMLHRLPCVEESAWL